MSKQQKKSQSIHLPIDLNEKIRKEAYKESRSFNKMVELILNEYFKGK